MYNWNENRYATIDEVAMTLPEELREYYKTTHLDTVIIEGNEIHGYFDYSYLDEKTYNKQPKRAIGGRLDLSTNTSFLTSRLIMKFKYLHIDDYRKVMRLIQSKDEVSVTCYDIVADNHVTRNMYFKPPKMPLIHQMNLQVLGVKDMEIELVGTNTDNATITVAYDYNLPAVQSYVHEVIDKQVVTTLIDPNEASQEFNERSTDLVGYMATCKNSTGALIPLSHVTISADNKLYKFMYWCTEPTTAITSDDDAQNKELVNGFHYLDNHAYYIHTPTKLYAQWRLSQ